MNTSDKRPQIIKVEAYEYFIGGAERQQRIDDFLSGKTTHLKLDYPLLEDLKDIKNILYHNSQITESKVDGNLVTIKYELDQAALVMQAAAAQRLLNKGDSRQLLLAQERLQEMNHELFGTPERRALLSVKKKVLTLIKDQVSIDGASQYYDELMNGFVFKGDDGKKVRVQPFLSAEEQKEISLAKPLPKLSKKVLLKLYEKINDEFNYARIIIENYWQDNIANRPAKDRVINSKDAELLFKECSKNYPDLATDIDIKIILNENSTATNWSSEENGIIVAGRRKPFKDVDEFFGVFIHEFGVHARRWMNGVKLNIPELSKGIYTLSSDGVVEDYLTFEEGLATTLQKAASKEIEKWDIASLGLYLVAGLGEERRSDREIFEIISRIRLLSKLNEKNKPTKKNWNDSRKASVNQIVRVFRGMPVTDLSNQDPALYLKDIVYLNGKIKVINYLNSMIDLSDSAWDEQYSNLFIGKIDNSNDNQVEMALNYIQNI